MSAYRQTNWPLWRKILFRFFFIYLALNIAPWTWLNGIPYVTTVTKYYDQLMDWAVNKSNRYLFHVRDVLVPINGSGDTSYGWAQVDLFLCLSLLGCVVWSIADRNRSHYSKLNYWLCLFTRYYVSLVAFLYGIIKLFLLQMPFPGYSMLSTTLGDLLPMRLSWTFIGYSSPYQVFSGAMEFVVGLLLLYRRTATMGALLGAAVFTNVMLLNFAYDIPVKIFSMHMVFLCLFLIANEYNRILNFFILNKPATVSTIYDYNFSKPWMKRTRVILKIVFIIVAVGWVFYDTMNQYRQIMTTADPKPLKRGIYDVLVFAVNRDTLPPLANDSLRWHDVAFDNEKRGSVNTCDTSFRQLYRRGYFNFSADTLKHTISFNGTGNRKIADFRYEILDSSTIKLWGKKNNDSLFVVLKRSNRHFQLAERQFHWLSEYNR